MLQPNPDPNPTTNQHAVVSISGGSRSFEKRTTMYQPRRHLSKMHTTNYVLFMREKAAY